ncbi:hypothetical protein SDC9_120155 [bioreactor metagenome]|uniref:Uncharacterized protein n=1 Tax=bioreactor metagenome TaxID=1076179 RepID=A0A645C6A8_9ZZZZ
MKGRLFDGMGQLPEEWVADVRDEQADGVRPLCPQRACLGIDTEAERLGRLMDRSFRGRRGPAGVREDTGCGGDGHARSACDIADGDRLAR